MTPKVILIGVAFEDYILAARAAAWLHGKFQKDAILSYGEGDPQKTFYVNRNKKSISVRFIK